MKMMRKERPSSSPLLSKHVPVLRGAQPRARLPPGQGWRWGPGLDETEGAGGGGEVPASPALGGW